MHVAAACVAVCRHGRATFSVLLFQDLAVVVLLMLIPLLAPDPSGANSGGMSAIATVSHADAAMHINSNPAVSVLCLHLCNLALYLQQLI